MGVGALGLSTSTDTAHMFPCAVLLAAFPQIIEAADFGFLHVSPAFVSRMENAIGVFVKTTTTADCIIRCFRSAAWGFVVTHITIGDSSRGRCTCGDGFANCGDGFSKPSPRMVAGDFFGVRMTAT